MEGTCDDCGNVLQEHEKDTCIMCLTYFCEICKIRHGKDYQHPLEVLDS